MSAEPLGEALPPARVARLPAELALGLRRSTRRGSRSSSPSPPRRRRAAPSQRGTRRGGFAPTAPRRAPAAIPRRAPVRRRRRCRCPAGPPSTAATVAVGGVLDVDERPDARALADDGELALADQLDLAAAAGRARIACRGRRSSRSAARCPRSSGARDRRLEVADRRQAVSASPAGGSGSSGSSSRLTGPPVRAYGQPALLWATKRLTPDRPARRQQVVGALGAQPVGQRELALEVAHVDRPAECAVSWCTITSGSASPTARPPRRHPARRPPPAARRALRSWSRLAPCGSSRRHRAHWRPTCGTSCLPSAPVAPATNTFMATPFSFGQPPRRRSECACDSSCVVTVLATGRAVMDARRLGVA